MSRTQAGGRAQCAAAFANLDRSLRADGRALADVAKLTVHMVAGRCTLAEYRAASEAALDDGALPAVSLVFVAALATPNILVMLDAVAA